MSQIDGEKLLQKLPEVRGRLKPNALMSELTWFRVGGPAEVLFTPADEEDLAHFLSELDVAVPVYVVGVGSNLLVRDGGVPGVVIRLGRGFAGMELVGDRQIRCGTAVPDIRLARFALEHLIDGLTFFRGIPGTIGGALRMNAGAHGGETKDVLVETRAVDRTGKIHVLRNADMKYAYRHSGASKDLIFTSGLFQGKPGNKDEISAQMEEITRLREEAQPIKSRTGGSTFKNPESGKSWQLIDAAGMRGARVGGAKVSEMHCNFLINEGDATARDIETLGEKVRAEVKNNSGVDLHWEIRRIGEET
jgi:UDP-N-acetylmuramate dehydrogenase